MTRRAAVAIAAVLGIAFAALAKEEKVEPPRLNVVVPLAAMPGEKLNVRLVGSKVDGATSILAGPTTRPIKTKTKPGTPTGAEATKAGDAVLEVEIAVPATQPAGDLPLAAVLPGGNTPGLPLLIMPAGSLIDEIPAHGGFRNAQSIAPGQTVRGAISTGGEVDVFKLSATSGQQITVEVSARRRGSILDSLVTVYDAKGHTVAQNDDAEGIVPDSRVTFTAPADGPLFIAVTDAANRGGIQFPYLLSIK